jgi:hypothetical protein
MQGPSFQTPLTMPAAAQEKGRNGFLARTGPPELIVHIFESCNSTCDLLALVSTCRHTYRVWQVHAAPALWRVWRREIPYIENALVAVSPWYRVSITLVRPGMLTASGS